jgi:Putative beta barrel porin-7 (BBP7)
MKNRFIITVAIVLLNAGLIFAQTPTVETPVPTLPTPNPITPAPVTTVVPGMSVTDTGISFFLPTRISVTGTDQFWATGDYLFTFVRGTNLPPLVTTSIPGTPRTAAGILGDPGTSTLFGSSWSDGDLRSGARFGMGYWFNPKKTLGVEAGFMMTETRASLFSANSTDGTILARPYVDATTGLQQAVLVAFPGSSNGSIDVRAGSGNFYTAHVDLTETALDYGWFRVTSLLGYRFYNYDESLRVHQVISPVPGNIFPFPAGTQLTSNDNFNTRNFFHGVDMGFRSQFFWNDLSLEVLTKVAIGRVTRTFTTEGDQTVTAPGVTPVTQPGGVLALAPNSGTFSSGDWKALPEFGATLNWQIHSNISARIGYSFLFLNGIARAADQVDTTINPNNFPGNGIPGGRPTASHIRSDMWIQAINLGMQFNF